jgi:glycosyltransferase involved in cell wall biosynthesis
MDIFVSLCTPTYNRRNNIKIVIEWFKNQNYPKELIEWIIIDDGEDKIEDLVKDIPQVKYYYYEEKINLGKKRNMCYEKSKGDIIFNIDDDDYYNENKITYTVNEMLKNKEYLISGSDVIYNYFTFNESIYKFGPYSKKNLADATIAFWREYLENNKYSDDKNIGLEREFLGNYKNNVLQLDPLKTILVISHNNNTVDRKKHIKRGKKTKITEFQLKDFINNENIIKMIKNQV